MMHRRGWIVWLVAVCVLLPSLAASQGVGIFSRADCSTITGPVTGETWCFDSTNLALKVWNGSAFVAASGGGTLDATYLTQIPNASLTAEQALSLLGTGLLVNTTATGVASIYAGASCPAGQGITALTAAGVATCAVTGGATPGSSLSGTVTISGTATTGAVVFGVAQADTNYSVTLGTRTNTGSPPKVVADYLSKAVGGFTVEITSAPGAGNSVDVDWSLNRSGAGSALSGAGVAGQVTYWTGVSTLGGSPTLLFGQTVNPIGNASIPTTSTLAAQATTTATDIRQFTGIFGLTSNQGAAHTGENKGKVALYAGLDALAGTGDVWSINSVLTQNAGSGSYNAQGYEMDVHNNNAHVGETDAGSGLSAPVTYGLSVTGAGSFRATSALLVTGSGFFGNGTITSITRSGAVATVTTTNPTTYFSGLDVTITGALQEEYNGSHTITVNTTTEFTYAVGGTPATPATTAGTLLSSVPLWNRGIVFANQAISYLGSTIQDLGHPGKVLDIRGHPRYGVYQNQADVKNLFAGGTILGPVPAANLPTFGNQGRLLVVTDDNTLRLDTGSAWVTVGPAAAGATVYRQCSIVVGSDGGAELLNGDLGPQRKQCLAPVAGTVVQVTVASDAGTPNVIVARRHCTVAPCTTGANETVSNLVSSALAAGPGTACSKVGATAGFDTFTTCSATLQNTALAAGDFVELVSGTAGGVAKRMTIGITWSEP